MNEFFPKRLCWFAEVPDHSYDPLESQQKTEQATSEIKNIQESTRSPEASQEAPVDSTEVVQKVLERDEKNLRALSKLEGTDPTEGMIKMKLVEKPTTPAYIESTNHQELQEQFRALRENTQRGVQDALRAA